MNLLLQMSFAGGMLIAAIALLRLFLQKYVHRSVLLLLWFLAVARLLVPILPPSETSVYNLPVFTQAEETQQIVTVTPDEAVGAVTQDVRTASPTVAASVPELPAVEAARPALSTEKLLLLIWAGVAVLLTAAFLAFHLHSCRHYRFSLPVPEGVELPKGLRVRMLDGLSAPLTYGVFRPVVLLPVDFPWEDSGRLEHILLHEQAHIRRRDVLKKYVFLLTACVHWFNPAAWLMFFLASQDMEMRCDAIAVKALGTGHKLDYAKTLVASETARVTGLLHTGFSFSTTAKRLQALIRTKNHPVVSVLTAVVLALSLSAIFLTGQAVQAARPAVVLAPEEEESIPTETGERDFTERYPEPFYVPSRNAVAQTEAEETEQTQEEPWRPFHVYGYPSYSIIPGESTEVKLLTDSEDVTFYTDQPKVVWLSVTRFTFSAFEPPYVAATVFGLAPGKAQIWCNIDGLDYYLCTVYVENTGETWPEPGTEEWDRFVNGITETEAPTENEIATETEPIAESELPTESTAPGESELPSQSDAPTESELPTEDTAPSETDTPTEEPPDPEDGEPE